MVTTCRVQGIGQIGAQELRIRREGREPVTVVRFANSDRVPDPAGLCALLARNHQGYNSPIAGVFQRLGVTPDGSGVVFEISNQFQLIGRTALRPEEQGFFYVRADGTGLRRLGPPSRDPTYRLFASTQGGVGGISAAVEPEIAISVDGRRIAYPDLGPGADGVETEHVLGEDGRGQFVFYSDCDPFGTNPDGDQLFVIDWDGSRLRQLTHTTGAVTAADGSVEVEVPGPAARGGR